MKLFQRVSRITFILLFISSSSLFGMVMDNRYFPWLAYVYNGSDHRHGCLRVDPFFITASSSFKVKPTIRDNDYGYPNLQGTLDYRQLAEALVLDGIENPIPAGWQYATPFPVDMPGSFEGQGVTFAGYVPLSDHIGIGGSIFFLRLATQANLVAAADTYEKLDLAIAGNQARFNELSAAFESLVGTQDGYNNQSGVSDFELYIRGYDVREYIYWCRKMDRSLAVGLLIPTGVQASLHNIGSVPFGGNGFWGWYFSPAIEVELKEDWKIGFEWRIQKRFAKTVDHRICVAEESNVFAPVIGPVYINQGVTASMTPYVALGNIREGLGILFKYVYVVHEADYFKDMREEQVPIANFMNMRANSRWAQEYITLELLYDLSFKHDWAYRPMCTLLWDIPLNVLGARGSSKTTRVAVGLTVDF
ncbi:hypothetical protein KBC04_04165 [Candidatus Babeliales bacterium]|nr:hypothetical protein [Candidatus Babeliales bacterium]MBP9843308.1 hypothetical protein [Candidatus Babeliales bacterium]